MKRRFPLVRSLLAAVALLAAAGPALAQGTEEQTEACSGDAFTLCRADIPDVGKITACMRVHHAELSPKCRKVFDASSGPATVPKPAERSVTAERAKTTPPKAARRTVVAPKTVAREPRALPRREPAPAAAVAPAPAPAPVSSVPGLDSYRASIVDACRKGLIDPYTCKSTLDLLHGME